MPVIAYGGRFRVVGPQGEREIEADKFFVMPDRNMYGETVLEPNELVTHVHPAARQPNVKSAHYEVKFKQSHDWPVTMASVALTMSGTTVHRRAWCSAPSRRCRGARRQPRRCSRASRSPSRSRPKPRMRR